MKIKAVFAVSLLFIALFSSIAFASQGDGKRVIARGLSAGELSSLFEQGCTVVYEFGDSNSKALKCPKNSNTDSEKISEDIQLFAFDMGANNQIKATNAWAQNPSINGSGRIIAVLDTGVDFSHPELASSIAGGACFISNCTSFSDGNGHGTHVAGIITSDGANSANSKGAAPQAMIFAGKVLDDTGSGYLSDTVAAINSLAGNSNLTIDAISLSLGSSQTWRSSNCDNAYPEMTNAINNAISKGITVVAAAGNTQSGVSLPGCISSVITVGAVDSKDQVASWSGRGYALKTHGVTAPGVNIYSTMPSYQAYMNAAYGYPLYYANLSGTSMATPIVSATVAFIKQKNPALSPSQVKQAIFNTAYKGMKKYSANNYGLGRIDAQAAANYN